MIYAIEGKTTLFSCSLDHEEQRNEDCLIEREMINAEKKMKDQLDKTYIIDIAKKMEETSK